MLLTWEQTKAGEALISVDNQAKQCKNMTIHVSN